MTAWEIQRKEKELKKYLRWRADGIRSCKGVPYGPPYTKEMFELNWHHATKHLQQQGFSADSGGNLFKINVL